MIHWRHARLLALGATMIAAPVGFASLSAVLSGRQPSVAEPPPFVRPTCGAAPWSEVCLDPLPEHLHHPPSHDLYERAALQALALRASGVPDVPAGRVLHQVAQLTRSTPNGRTYWAPAQRGRAEKSPPSDDEILALSVQPVSMPEQLVSFEVDRSDWHTLVESGFLPADPDAEGLAAALPLLAEHAAGLREQALVVERERLWDEAFDRQERVHTKEVQAWQVARSDRRSARVVGAVGLVGSLAVLLAALASTYVVRRPAGAPVSAFDSTLPTWRSQWLPADPKAWATAGIDEPPPVGSRPSLRWPVLPAAVFASLVAWVLLPAAVVWLMNGDPGQFGTVAAAVGILGAHLVALATCLASVRQRLDPTAPQGVPANGEVASVDPARVHFTVDTLELRLPVRTRTRGRLFAFGLHVVVMLVCAVPMMLLSAAAVASSSSAAWLVIVALLVMAIALALWLAAAVGTAAAVVFGASELWDRAVQPRWIRLGARTLLTSEGEDFALDAPGLTTRLAWDGDGAQLHLRSDLQEVTVRGPYRELNWLRAHLLHRPATDHDPGQATRAAIAGLIAASGARVPSG